MSNRRRGKRAVATQAAVVATEETLRPAGRRAITGGPASGRRRAGLGILALTASALLGPAVGAAVPGAGWATSLLTTLAVGCAGAAIAVCRLGLPRPAGPAAEPADHQMEGCLSFQGRASSSWADREIRVASSPIRPASITPMGSPSALQCSGTLTAGWPDML